MNDIYSRYDERHARAWEAFNAQYQREYPRPQPPAWYVGLPWAFGPFLLIAAAGILLSALRTAPVFAKIAEPMVGQSLAAVEAVLALIVVEVSIVVIRFIRVLHDAADGRLDEARLRGWMQRGFMLAFAIAVMANVYASVSHVPLFSPLLPVSDLIMATAVGVSAPVLALVSGDLLGAILVRASRVRAQQQHAYRAELERWEAGRTARWNARKADLGLRLRVDALSDLSDQTNQTDRQTDRQRLSDVSDQTDRQIRQTDRQRLLSDPRLSDQTDRQSDRSDNQTDRQIRQSDNQTIRQSDNQTMRQTDQTDRQTMRQTDQTDRQTDRQLSRARQRVVDWLDEHPDDIDLSARALAERITEQTGVRVGHDTVSKVLSSLREAR